MSDLGIPSSLGARVAHLRDRRGWTQKDLAQQAGLSGTFISDIENDKRNVSSEVLLKLADALRTSLDYLLRGEDTRAEREPDVVPVALAAAADEHGWPYGETLDTLRVRRTVVARRSPRGEAERSINEWTAEDWVELHDQLFE